MFVVAFVVTASVAVGSSGVGFALDAGADRDAGAAGFSPPLDATRSETSNGTADVVGLGDAGTTFVGENGSAFAGTAVAGAGDFDGDGVGDVAVSAPYADGTGNDSGAVYLFYGPVENGTVPVSEADAALVGESADDRAGASLAVADLNDDGRSDLVVGAPASDHGGNATGAAYAVYGDESLTGTVSLSAADATLLGAAEGDAAGAAVAAIPNLTDGTGGVVVGAPGNDAGGTDAGAAYVLADVPSNETPLADAGTVLVGASNRTRTGAAVASAGDANDDGTPDVLVGAPLWDGDSTRGNDGADAGAAYVVTEAVDAGTTAIPDAGHRLTGANAGDRAGSAVVGAGDVTGDGVDDVVVGAPRADANGNESGSAYLVAGGEDLGDRSLASAEATLVGASTDRAGAALGTVESGVATCDGTTGLLVGAPDADVTEGEFAGAAYLVRADGLDGRVPLSNATTVFVGGGDGDTAGRSVASVDATGDGGADVVVGAPGNDSGGDDAGAASLVGSDCPTEAVNAADAAETTATSTTEAAEETTTEATSTTTEGTTDTTGTTTEEPTTTETTTEEPTTTEGTTTTETTTTGTTEETSTTTTEETTTTETTTEETSTTETTTEETTTATTEPDEPFRPSVAFDCTEVTVEAESYRSVTLTFEDGSERTFEGPFDGTERFAGDGAVVRSISVSDGETEFSTESPVADDCGGNLRPGDSVDRDGDRRSEPPSKDGERGGSDGERRSDGTTTDEDGDDRSSASSSDDGGSADSNPGDSEDDSDERGAKGESRGEDGGPGDDREGDDGSGDDSDDDSEDSDDGSDGRVRSPALRDR